jgi:putative transposase
MALLTRKPDAVIHHSDQGCQYTAVAFGQRCGGFGVRPSMGTVGEAYENEVSVKANLRSRLSEAAETTTRWRRASSQASSTNYLCGAASRVKAKAKTALFTYIEAWYNLRRRHSGIDYLSPTKFEEKNAQRFEQRVIHSPAPVSSKGQHERGAMDNPYADRNRSVR